MIEPTFHVLDDPAAALAELLAAEAKRGGTIVLTGGSSVGHAYPLAALRQPDWSQAAVYWGDERCVPPGEVTDSRSSTGWTRSSRSSFAVPSIVWTTRRVETSRDSPSRIPASIIASASSA